MNHELHSQTIRAAAIEDDGSCDVDALLAEVAERLGRAGRRVGGLLMTYPQGRATCAGEMVLVDIETRETYLVSQPLGSGSSGCRADPQGFARASVVLRRLVGRAPDLVICNRFGRLEVEGGGFRAEMLDLMASDVPVLTVVSSRFRDDWLSFTGDAALLRPDIAVVDAWLWRCLAESVPDGAVQPGAT
ncbi:MAG: DUF2478 domain-containing protein [Burkholderiaceae bacterium]